MLGKMIENYSLQELLGEGVYGKVFKALNVKTKQEVAVKVIRAEKFREIPKLQECTVNEINTLTTMEPNEHIVKYIDMLKTVNNFYFVYQYCNGGTLEKILQNYRNTPDRVMPEKKTLIYFRQIVDAFKTLTKNNIMHRDLKPDNILLHNGIIKLADFGFCKSLKSPTQMAQTMLGSPIYMAPEVLKGEIYTMKADIWSLGVVLYEMLTGECPFQSNSIAKLIQILDTNQLSFPQNFNPSLEKLLKRILVKDHTKRIDWSQLFEFKITETGQLIEPKPNLLNLVKPTNVNGFNSSVSQNLLSINNTSKNQSSILSKNGSFDSGGYSANQYQTAMMRKKSPMKDIKQNNENGNSSYGPFFNPNLSKANNNNSTNISSRSPTINESNNDKYDQLVKSHKKNIVVVKLAIDVLKYPVKQSPVVCYIIMKTVQKELGELSDTLKKEIQFGLNSVNESQFGMFKTMVQNQYTNIQIFSKNLKQEIDKILESDKVQTISNNKQKYVKLYIEGMKLENQSDQNIFIHVSQLLDYFQDSILLKRDTYQRLSKEQLHRQIMTKISKF